MHQCMARTHDPSSVLEQHSGQQPGAHGRSEPEIADAYRSGGLLMGHAHKVRYVIYMETATRLGLPGRLVVSCRRES
jgi:hypothetical protein